MRFVATWMIALGSQCLGDSKLARVSTLDLGLPVIVREGFTRLPLFILFVSADVEYIAAIFASRVPWPVEQMHRMEVIGPQYCKVLILLL